MIHVHFHDRLEVDAAAQLRLGLVLVVEQRATLAVEHEPTTVPRFELHAAHLEQKAAARCRREVNVRRVEQVSGTFDVSTEIEINGSNGEVTCQRSFLHSTLLA